jgi:hypothetical protein
MFAPAADVGHITTSSSSGSTTGGGARAGGAGANVRATNHTTPHATATAFTVKTAE